MRPLLGLSPGKRLLGGRTGTVAVALAVAATSPGQAQDASRLHGGTPPELAAARAATVLGLKKEESSGPGVDIHARFAEFQRDFAADFGVKLQDDEEKDSGPKVGEAFVQRWEGTIAWRWYERMLGVYDRLEGFYQRLERSTRWATSEVSVDPDLEAAVDGKLRLHVERDLGAIDAGLDVDDAVNGRLGLRLGGLIRGYKVSFAASDVVAAGRVSVQVRKIVR